LEPSGEAPQCFLWGGLVCVMADGGHHGKCQHDERHVAVPAVPGPGFVVVEAQLVLGGLEAVLDALQPYSTGKADGTSYGGSVVKRSFLISWRIILA